ncbi:membrane protein [Hyphomicrobium nitrativorans NL23]|uniref:Membrane protein n=1 Tax=Hyphomicrobium nitrativorans NL23 TaxID=1029756 RepID=V5SG08_9HYPH|nr:membrane protein [Hyphomicrobium nitrativorans]AHB48884.1 membrane protein [Hyphomicrobium nitrativorans NL23]
MNWSIEVAPLVPVPLLWAAAAAACVLLAILIARRSRGALWRAAAVAALLAALLNPTLREEERESLANIALVVVDESTSQALDKRPEQRAAIRANLEARLGGIKNLEVKWLSASGGESGTAQGTQLFAALNEALTNTPPDRIAGVIMITDGQVHDVPKEAAALGFNAPVHTLLTGTPDEFDRRIEILEAPRYGLVGQSREIELAVRETGKTSRATGPVTLNVRREGRPDQQVSAEIDRPVTIEMPFPHAGTNIVEVELETAPGELTPANNRVVVVAEGVRENLRVLLVSGEPHAGERTWRNLLKSDAAVDLVHFTILRPPEKQDGTPINQLSLIAFPTKELFSDRIRDFDLIIFDRYEHRGILQLIYYDNIARYVENGGAVLVAAGDDYAGMTSLYRTPLSPVLPAAPTGRVIEEPFRARITEEGLRHPVTQGLPGANTIGPDRPATWGHWFRQAEVRLDRGRPVMEGAQDQPLLVLDRRGTGRVALLLSDHAWLWARGYDGGGPHTDLLRRLSHWLMKEPDLEEERLLASARGLKVTLERRTLEDQVGPVTMSAPGGERSDVVLERDRPGVWKAMIDVKLPGLYKAETQGPAGPLTAVAHAGVEDPREMSEVVATADKLKPLTDKTGGGVFWTRTDATTAGDAVTLPRVAMMTGGRVMAGSGWMGLADREAFLTKGVKLTPMFNGLIALAALLALMAMAWWREGR